VNVLERAGKALDRRQQRSSVLGFVVAVVKKYGDDRGGSLAALVAYYGFVSLFPLLLLLVTILGIVVGDNTDVARRIEHSALSQFPIIGSKIGANLHALHRSSVAGLVIGTLGLLWGSQGASQAAQHAMADIWNVPEVARPSYWVRLSRTGVLTVALGAFLLVSTGLAGLATFAGRPVAQRLGSLVLSLAVDVALYLVAFRVLTPRLIPNKALVPGAVLGGLGWAALQLLGTFVVDHLLRNTSQVYGFFAFVLGLLAYIALAAQMSLYAAEVNVVRARRLWPRSLFPPPLTPADIHVLTDLATQAQRRPEQSVRVRFDKAGAAPQGATAEEPGTADELRPGENRRAAGHAGPEHGGTAHRGTGIAGAGGHPGPVGPDGGPGSGRG